MITHLKGRLVEKNPTFVVIECGGVGYFVNISLHTFSKITRFRKYSALYSFTDKGRLAYPIRICGKL